eukprot:TRINITY_DN3861_c0_g2_i1.p1 TRINITY_DN3861_c0_g2~~TRINITY_DN3861_c0_g2_i1.p1  ORF type:complete len:335 (-),score=74.94 TRINITY_DN3861_c0_g2_i1:9-1013(-)
MEGNNTQQQEQEVDSIVVSQYGGPEVLVHTTKKLAAPAAGQVLVAVKAVGVNPVDTYIRSGTYARAAPLPYTPGSDAAGVIEAVGEGVTNVKVGDRVYTAGTLTGSYAAKALAKADQVHTLPSNTEFAAGACLYVPAGTAYRSLIITAHARAGEVVFIHGASGGVGIAAVQLARAHGLIVIGTASTEKGRELVLKEGAHYVFDHKSEDYIPKVKEAAAKHGGIHIILEMLANVNLTKDLELISFRGRIVIIGNRGSLDFNPRTLMATEALLTGMGLANSTPEEFKAVFAGINAALENGSLRPIIGEQLPLSDASKAHHDIINSTHLGNIVLLPK